MPCEATLCCVGVLQPRQLHVRERAPAGLAPTLSPFVHVQSGMQLTLEPFLASAPGDVGAAATEAASSMARRRVVSLFDNSGLSVLPWLRRGFQCTSYDVVAAASASNDGHVPVRAAKLGTSSELLACLGDLADLAFVVALPPCRDLCAAGARWWERKRRQNPDFQKTAEDFLRDLYKTLECTGVPFVILVPSSPHIRKCFTRKAVEFNPYEFGAYLGADAAHPLFPESIPKQDAYTKRTLCFAGHGVKIPWKKPVAPQFELVKTKSGRLKRISPIMKSRRKTGARTAPPLAFCTALASINSA